MADDYHPLDRRPNPERIDLGAIKADLEFLIERTERFRKEQALKPNWGFTRPANTRHTD